VVPGRVERYVIRNAERQARSVDKRDEYLRSRLAEQKSTNAEQVAVFPKVSTK
jgi:hypothetical protein